jgi:hypothetical protein
LHLRLDDYRAPDALGSRSGGLRSLGDFAVRDGDPVACEQLLALILKKVQATPL